MGFSLASATARRRMLFFVHIDGQLEADDMAAAFGCADAAIVARDGGGCQPVLETGSLPQAGIPVGVSVMEGGTLPSEGAGYDFLLCDLSGPSEALVCKERGLIVQVEGGVEAGNLRAIGELGVDALVLNVGEMDPYMLSTVVECRRVRAASGKSLILRLSRPVTEGLLAALWQSGVDGLLAETTLGADALRSMRAVLDGASFDSRPASKGLTVAIGAQMSSASVTQPDEDEGDGGEEEDGDEDE